MDAAKITISYEPWSDFSTRKQASQVNERE